MGFCLPSAPASGRLMHIVYTLSPVIKQYTVSSPSGGCRKQNFIILKGLYNYYLSIFFFKSKLLHFNTKIIHTPLCIYRRSGAAAAGSVFRRSARDRCSSHVPFSWHHRLESEKLVSGDVKGMASNHWSPWLDAAVTSQQQSQMLNGDREAPPAAAALGRRWVQMSVCIISFFLSACYSMHQQQRRI